LPSWRSPSRLSPSHDLPGHVGSSPGDRAPAGRRDQPVGAAGGRRL